jgi:predicted nuclease of restriction endonuclease-like (RecB) superfamily
MSKDIHTNGLLNDIDDLIKHAKQHVSKEFNVTHVLLNWHIGNRINQEILNNDRAGYGKTIIVQLSEQLQAKHGSGYDKTALSRMIKFAKIYPEMEAVARISQQLRWTHIIQLIAIKDDLKRDFYTEMCLVENWGAGILHNNLDSMYYERTGLAKKPEKLIKQDIEKIRKEKVIVPEIIFHDPQFLRFVGLPTGHSENDLENTILNELTVFMQEFGSDFCFVARQKKMSTERTDRYLDLLFYHRGMRRLIAIELKIGRFEPSHKGQMEWYLNWLDKNERKPGEEKPLGIILCSDKDQEDIEYLEFDNTGIHISQYLTELPPKEILEAKLKKAIAIAREKYEDQKLLNMDEDKDGEGC